MQRRIQITENIEVRELTEPGTFGLFATGKNEFLQQDGAPIALQPDDILVLPKTHTAEKLDLNPRLASGEIAGRDQLLFVENHGNSVELAGNNLAVIGRAHVKVSAWELAGIDKADLQEGKVRATSFAGNMSDLMEAGVHVPAELKGRVMNFGEGQHIVAIDMPPYGQHNRIDFVDKASDEKLYTIIGDTAGEDHKMANVRFGAMQELTLPKLAETLTQKNTEQLKLFGFPEEVISAANKEQYSAVLPQPDPFGRNYPVVPADETEEEKTTRLKERAVRKEETPEEKEAREEFLKQFEKASRVIPDGSQKISGVEPSQETVPDKTASAETSASSVTQEKVNEALSHNVLGLPNHVMVAAIQEREHSQARIDKGSHDHNSVQAPANVPQQHSEEKQR